jgi:7,8-dihydroneopterin aldolase/epimerase/oxygenase
LTRGPSRISETKVFVRGLEVHAEIGIYEHEQGRTQSLIVDIEVTVEAGGWRHLADTVNYETLAAHAERIAAGGHIGLVESFAERLAEACLSEPRVTAARVRVDKPAALAPRAAGAGVEVLARRG